VAECELKASGGIKGVLLTRQPTSKNNIGRTVALARREPTFGTVVDDPLVAGWLQEAAAAEGVTLTTVVDVFAGLTRHGIEAGKPAIELAKKVDSSKNLKLIGLMGYSGGASHTKGFNDRRKKSQDDLAGLQESVSMATADCRSTSSRADPGDLQHRQRNQRLTELQAGSFVFMDTLYRQIGGKQDPVYSDFGLALTVMTQSSVSGTPVR
jgi:D-serine deaminase-like pyridoxal phosphate-dependent protein